MKIVGIISILVLFSCQKPADLGENYKNILGKWSDPERVTTITFKATGQIKLHSSVERGLTFKAVTCKEIVNPYDGTISLYLSSRNESGKLTVAISPVDGRIRLRNPISTDTLNKL